ncbi:MAG TPA: hypothetical protein VM261_14560 [Kofleriaceae bacterium]|nr:hypothetical protein [Kofleriaceae bacterium]
MRFPDPKLHLAMIDEVHRRRSTYAWVASQRAAYEATSPAMSWSALEDNTSEHAVELERFLATLPIADRDLEDIDALTLDGDRDLYAWVYPSWWNFGDHFAIHDLTGLERCARLRYLLLGQGLVAGASLKPVARIPRLVELHLCARCHLADIPALLDAASLKKLDVVNVGTSDERAAWESVIAELRVLGVAVEAR